MTFGVESGHKCEVIWECDAREAGIHVLRGNAIGDDGVQRRSQATVEKVGSETIERDIDSGWRKESCAVREQGWRVCP